MATPLSDDRLLRALREEGVDVVEHPGWRTRQRPPSTGGFGPINGVMIHHTVTSGTSGSVDLCIRGHSSLPGPLCHGVIDKQGRFHLISNGRANHAGRGDSTVLTKVRTETYNRDALLRPTKADTDGNSRFYGFECINLGDGKDPWPAEQRDCMVRASAAILRAYGGPKDGWTARSMIGHLEWQPGKIDPRSGAGGVDVSPPTLRRLIDDRLAHPASWNPSGSSTKPSASSPKPTRPQQEDDVPNVIGEYDTTDRQIGPRKWKTLDIKGVDIVTGATRYTVMAHLTLTMPPGSTVQGRFYHLRPDGSRWESGIIERPATAGLTFADFHHSGSIARDEKLRFEVAYYPADEDDTEPVTVQTSRLRGLYW
ncbi:N-acetylmuramoyl-L-alanine amidase [Streptomyces macrosporus]|uniref:N-acetylmuramoyl-L-alanine amidase domain-containing protein n=1 Tax=Streptomyces macrosporus TaxID=44032 RepID=A0ABP5XLE0_9ACTN